MSEQFPDDEVPPVPDKIKEDLAGIILLAGSIPKDETGAIWEPGTPTEAEFQFEDGKIILDVLRRMTSAQVTDLLLLCITKHGNGFRFDLNKGPKLVEAYKVAALQIS